VLNVRDHTVKYLDPLAQSSKLEDLLYQLFRFLKAEMWQHDRRLIENTSWTDLHYVKASEHRRFPMHDSGVYVCRQAELLTGGSGCEPELAGTYRRQIQETVLKVSKRV
jgi:hypothetical protein